MENTSIETFKKVQELKVQVSILLSRIYPNYNNKMTTELALFTAQHTKSQIPMYIGGLNPKWKMYDDMIKMLDKQLAD